MENRDEEMVDGEEEQASADGVTDEELGFTNSFEALNSVPMVQTHSRKKTKANNNGGQLVGSLRLSG